MRSGIYQHYKGMLFLVLGEATLEGDDLKPAIIYQALYDDYRLWVRTAEDFVKEVSMPEYDYHGPRFRFVKSWTTEDALLHPQAHAPFTATAE
jgi:hypothetical protein